MIHSASQTEIKILRSRKLNGPKIKEKYPKDKWKWIEFADGYYEISQYGRIITYHFTIPRIVKPRMVNGYKQFTFLTDGKLKSYYIHKLVYLIFKKHKYNSYATLPYISHNDYNLINNWVGNLFVLTTREKINARIRKHYPLGSGVGRTKSKISDKQAIVIKKQLAKGSSLRQLSQKYNTSDMSIHRAAKRNIPGINVL